MNKVDQLSQDLMLKFLHNNFPVKKLRDGRRFKRGIIIENGFSVGPTRKLFLNEPAAMNALIIVLASILTDVFAFTPREVNLALTAYLKTT